MQQSLTGHEPVLDEAIVREVLGRLREHPGAESTGVTEGHHAVRPDLEQSLSPEAVCDYWLSQPWGGPGCPDRPGEGDKPRGPLSDGV